MEQQEKLKKQEKRKMEKQEKMGFSIYMVHRAEKNQKVFIN